ncbi:hypothetical protein VTP01DRAFT_6883 [Rhizomucor pusillus]|uniref:uncharacterized protein n=1 Tax=Rhizomucor pusillus TaxID=4840 RepID=UPI003741FD54
MFAQNFLSRECSRKNAPAVYKEVHKQLFSSLSDEQKPNPSYSGTFVKRHKTYNPLKVYQRLLDDLEKGKTTVSEPIEPNDQEEEEQQALDGNDGDLAGDNKAIRTVTASLQNIVHPDFEPSVLQEAFRKEQEIVSKHMKFLSRFIEAFITKVTTGEISKISGYPDSTTKAVDIDFRDFATNFEFDKEAETKLLVAPVQEDLQKFHQSKVYTVEHLSNIMSGCVGRSINEKEESETFKQIRQLLLQAVNGDKQDASFRHSPTIADASLSYCTPADYLGTTKIGKILRKRQEKVEEKKEEGQQYTKAVQNWGIQSLERLKSAISQPREQTRSNVRTEDAYESNVFDLSEEEDEDNIEKQEITPIAQSNQTPKEPSASLLRAFLNVIRFLL